VAIKKLEHENEVIADVLTGLDTALVTLIEDESQLGGVRDHVDLLDRVLNSHLDYEEQELVEPLDRLNTTV
jgi:hypothetical protein